MLRIYRTGATSADIAASAVREYHWSGEPDEPMPLGITFAVIFDSTHFSYTQSITVSLEIRDFLNATHQLSRSAPIKNLAALYGRAEFEQSANPLTHGVPPGINHLTEMNYDFREGTTAGWTFSDLMADLESANILYVQTHGGHTNYYEEEEDGGPSFGERYWFQTSHDEVAENPKERVLPTAPLLTNPSGLWEEIASLMPARNGTGNPPYNSTENPPLNIVFLDACNTGRNNSFAEAFLLPYVYHQSCPCACGQGLENQAFLSYRVEVSALEANSSMEVFWSKLEEGRSVWEARNELFEQYFLPGVDTAAEFLSVWGDFCTRAHQVYNHTYFGNPSSSWFL